LFFSTIRPSTSIVKTRMKPYGQEIDNAIIKYHARYSTLIMILEYVLCSICSLPEGSSHKETPSLSKEGRTGAIMQHDSCRYLQFPIA
ncbi:MAG: hypothetical protein SPJ34_06100, partial [Candidatus Ornithospirochaeta sp.]|nr:hypothetical protein [Candidatus Ornithospirochaeta sp.]